PDFRQSRRKSVRENYQPVQCHLERPMVADFPIVRARDETVVEEVRVPPAVPPQSVIRRSTPAVRSVHERRLTVPCARSCRLYCEILAGTETNCRRENPPELALAYERARPVSLQ